MRIIAGERRGHTIESVPGRELRPTSDMVREAVFDILRDAIEDRTVIDLFAGTGALGLEALSRGARRTIFVERDREHVRLIRRNLARLRYLDRGIVIPADAYRWGRFFQPAEDSPFVVFIDPPYREFERHPQLVRKLLDALILRLPAESTLILESGGPLGEILPEPDAWDQRRYGSTRLALRTLNPSLDPFPLPEDEPAPTPRP